MALLCSVLDSTNFHRSRLALSPMADTSFLEGERKRPRGDRPTKQLYPSPLLRAD